MKRPLCIAAAAVLLAALPATVTCAPLSDVTPADWAYHSISSLAARGIIEGFPDGRFHGERPATRKEMAAVVSRTLAQAEAEAAPRSDLERTGQLIDALKDELDALSVRVSRLEKRLGTPQQQGFTPQSAVRRISASKPANQPPREMVDVRRISSPALSRADVAVLAAGTFRDLQTTDASKGDLERAHRALNAIGDKLSLLSARLANLDASPGASQRPQPMMRIAIVGASVDALDRVALHWVRLDNSILGAVAGIAFHPNAYIVPAAQYSLVGQTVFGLNIRPALALNAAPIGATDGLLAAYAPKGLEAFTFAAPFGTTLNLRTLARPPQLGGLLTIPTPIGLTQTDPLNRDQATSTAPTLALPGAAPALASSFAVPTLAGERYALDVQSASPLNVPQLRVNFTVPQNSNLAAQTNFGLAHLQGLDRNGGSAQPCTILPALCAAAFGSGSFENQVQAATTFDIRTLGRHVSLNLGGSYEQLHRPSGTGLPYVPYDPAVDNLDSPATRFTPLTFDPNYVDVLKRTLNAAAAVPISRDLTLNLQYDTEYYTGSYQSFGQSIDERKDSYLGNLTYTIPRTASTIVFSAKQYRYRDAFLPTYNQTQNRADLNFTIKF
ncbi:MAG: S-layer homology domain-containing protein [Candidatus Eremiobacteraeota bacterium]|nr:S-layer homology domain-containing protein [Candidatus Eremiobacteraeota bacterium]